MDFVNHVWGGVKRAFLGSTILLLVGFMVLSMSVATLYDRSDASSSPMASESGEPKFEYYLPYPGILPDSQLYKVKVVRDWALLWMTVDTEKKIERKMLYADKRIGAAKYLVEGGKLGLGVSTATKAEKYLESAFLLLDQESRGGKDVKSLLLKIKNAAIKHQEILEEIMASVTGTDRSVADETLKMNKLLQQRIGQTWVEAK